MTLNTGGVIMRPRPPLAAPVFTSIAPDSGDDAEAVVVTGTGFRSDTILTFDGTLGDSIVVPASTTINCNVPTHADGAVDIVITNSDAQAVTASSAFEYTSIPDFSTETAAWLAAFDTGSIHYVR